MKKPEQKEYDVNEERINRINFLLSELPRIAKRIDQINAVLFSGGIDSREFIRLSQERSVAVKRYQDLEEELHDTYRIENENGREKAVITSINIEQ